MTAREPRVSSNVEVPSASQSSAVPNQNHQSFRAEVVDQVQLAAPVCLGLLCNRFIATVSTVLVGRQGASELAAVGLAVSLANVSGYSILVGVAGTLQTTAGQAFGASNFAEVSLSLQRCALLCSFVTCIIAVLWLNAETLLLHLGQEEKIAALAAKYLALLLPGLCCYMITQCLQNWLAAQRVTSPTGSGGMINAVMYLPLCWTLVNTAGLGFEGAAIATSLANCFLMLWMVFNTVRISRSTLRSSWQGFSRQALSQWCPFLRLALPNFLMISEWWAAEITVLLAGTLPQAELSLAALALFSNTNSICFMTPLSFGIAANTRVSNELGAGRIRCAAYAARISCVLGLLVVTFTSLLLLIFRRQWVALFTSDVRVLEHAMPVVALSAAYTFVDGFAGVLSGSLKGCSRHPILAPIVIASYYFVGLPCSCIFAWPLNLNTFGLALGSTVGTFIHCSTFFLCLSSTDWASMSRRAQEGVSPESLLHGSDRTRQQKGEAELELGPEAGG